MLPTLFPGLFASQGAALSGSSSILESFCRYGKRYWSRVLACYEVVFDVINLVRKNATFFSTQED